MLKTIVKSRNQLLHQKTNQMNLDSEAGKNDNVNTIPMNNDEEKKLKEEQKLDPVLQEVLDIWNKDFKNDIWKKWSYGEIFEKLKSKILIVNLN
nr:hypothetical protein [Mycoplasmopsis bovis]